MKNLSIKIKLIIFVFFASMALIGVGLVGNYGIQKTSESLNLIGNTRLPSIIGLGIITEGQILIRLANRDMMLHQNNYGAQQKFVDILKNKQTIMARLGKGWAIYSAQPKEPEEAQVWRAFVPAWEEWKQSQEEVNVTIEAARAGEQGRGFAVVAGEVRNLAQRAAAAAKEIKNLINDSEDKVEDGSKLVAQAGYTMQEIVDAILQVTAIMSEISAASVEQSSGIAQVNQAVAQMDDVTQQNAALVEQAAAESMAEQAQNLSAAVDVFKISANQHTLVAVSRDKPILPVKIETYKGKNTGSAKQTLQLAESDEWEEF